MAVQFSTALRNALLDSGTTFIEDGNSYMVVRFYSGSPPATPETTATGTNLASVAGQWAAASGGTKAKTGTNMDAISVGTTGTIGYFRLQDPTDGVTTGIQGTVTLTGGGGDLELNAVAVTAGQHINITAWTFTAGNP